MALPTVISALIISSQPSNNVYFTHVCPLDPFLEGCDFPRHLSRTNYPPVWPERRDSYNYLNNYGPANSLFSPPLLPGETRARHMSSTSDVGGTVLNSSQTSSPSSPQSCWHRLYYSRLSRDEMEAETSLQGSKRMQTWTCPISNPRSEPLRLFVYCEKADSIKQFIFSFFFHVWTE